MPFGIYHRRFRPLRFVQAAETVVILCLRVCFVCVFLLSITTDSAHFLSFRRSNRGDIVSWGSFSMYPHSTADSVWLHSFRLSNRGYIVMLVAFVLC